MHQLKAPVPVNGAGVASICFQPTVKFSGGGHRPGWGCDETPIGLTPRARDVPDSFLWRDQPSNTLSFHSG